MNSGINVRFPPLLFLYVFKYCWNHNSKDQKTPNKIQYDLELRAWLLYLILLEWYKLTVYWSSPNQNSDSVRSFHTRWGVKIWTQIYGLVPGSWHCTCYWTEQNVVYELQNLAAFSLHTTFTAWSLSKCCLQDVFRIYSFFSEFPI